jgi:hypothetical protein
MRTRWGALERIEREKWRETVLRALRATGGIVPDAAYALGISPMQVLDLLREEGYDARRARLRRLGELVRDEPEVARTSVTTLRNLRARSSLPSVPPSR